ncbi:MerR family DNA-binding transcriptional regulator [Kitasatospora sp. NPDC004669]|uniref:MerR family DNA-binding transcriptional regulator n=1 Tax=Kitasatospora sp. NPDC004669 TaxID=3154555 RepID=UPI00339EA921
MDDLQQNRTGGEVAARTGLSMDNLRFYEREGILANPVRRGAGGATPRSTSTG